MKPESQLTVFGLKSYGMAPAEHLPSAEAREGFAHQS